jgi:DNA-binding SARP family transcriptional activator
MTTLRCQLHLLGGFRLGSEGRPVAVSTTAAKLLALLAVNGRPMTRTQVAGTLWPALTEQRAAANLRSIIWRLPPAVHDIVVPAGSALDLADTVDVDLERVQLTVRQVLDGECFADCVQAPVVLLCEPLLPEWDDDWLVFERERIRQLHIHALERLGASLLDAGDPLSAVDVGTAVIGAEPLRESAHILVIRAHLAAGNRPDARRCYERYRDLLERELNLEPAIRWETTAPGRSRRDRRRTAPGEVALTVR